MGRLVDADELKAELSGKSYPINTDKHGRVMGYTHLDILTVIDTQPTAYDVDKVVEQISEYLNGYRICVDYDGEFFLALEEYITNLVKGAINHE